MSKLYILYDIREKRGGNLPRINKYTDTFKFRIPNFNKYHPNKGYKKSPWIRLDVDFFDDGRIFQLTPNQKLLYLFLLSSYGRTALDQDGSWVTLSYAQVRSTIALRVDHAALAISRLEQLQLLEVSNETQKGSNERYERTKRNERNERNEGGELAQLSAEPTPLLKEDPWLFSRWNETCVSLPKVKVMNRKRENWLKSRMKAFSKQEWLQILQKIENSRFCRGENDRGWVATFEWLIRDPENPAKVLEGKYDNRARILRTREDAVSEGNAALYQEVMNEGAEL